MAQKHGTFCYKCSNDLMLCRVYPLHFSLLGLSNGLVDTDRAFMGTVCLFAEIC